MAQAGRDRSGQQRFRRQKLALHEQCPEIMIAAPPWECSLGGHQQCSRSHRLHWDVADGSLHAIDCAVTDTPACMIRKPPLH